MGRADIATCLISAQTARLQRTQIIWHVAELSQHGRIAEIASSRITSAAERGCAAIDRVFRCTAIILVSHCLPERKLLPLVDLDH
jgi:hypothetical protein